MDTPSYQTSARRVRTLVEQVRRTNWRTGVDRRTGFRYAYLCPSPDKYRWQWFWDSCFHAIIMAHVNPEMAVAELRTLVHSQEPNGFIGHVSFWGSRLLSDLWGRVQSTYAWRQRHTALIQPPMLAQAVERVTEVLGDPWIAVEFLPILDRYHEWLAEYRAPDDDGLLVIISPYESGMDQSPVFDQVLGFRNSPGRWSLGLRDRWLDFRNAMANYQDERLVKSGPFRVKDALVNALYADSLSTMARLHRRHGNQLAANAYTAQTQQVAASLTAKMWDRSRAAFFNLYGTPERRTQPLTVGGLIPLVVAELPEETVHMLVERHLQNRDEFFLEYPVPSVAATEATFNPRGQGLLWRGPTWVNTNWLLWRGLRRHGFQNQATRLAEQTAAMVARAGLREFYNPHTGAGLGARNFVWSGLVLDMGVE